MAIDNTEYIFDESGGRGTPAPTFFKRLVSSGSKTSSNHTILAEPEIAR